MDRFIPSDSSHQRYRSLPQTSSSLLSTRRSLPNIRASLNAFNLAGELIRPVTVSTSRRVSTATTNSTSSSSNGTEPSNSKDKPLFFNGVIARALGVNSRKRVLIFSKNNKRTNSSGHQSPLKYGSPSSSSKSRSKSANENNKKFNNQILNSIGDDLGESEATSLLISTMDPRLVAQILADIPETVKRHQLKSPVIRTIVPANVLDAPGLRNDFYSNLVSWSKQTGKLVVGLEHQVFLWRRDQEALLLPLDNDEFFDVITCLSFSENDYLLIGSRTGKLVLYSQSLKCILAEYYFPERAIFTICWKNNSPDDEFFLGLNTGEIYLFEIKKNEESMEVELVEVCCIVYHKQQICGIAINNDNSELAVGSNDNICSIWDLSNPTSPQFKFALPHRAAIKAVAYCPWSKSLLATGGGSRDRQLRFWHTGTGTLLNSLSTSGQITSVIWSKSQKQIAITFGYGTGDSPLLISIYSFPLLKPLIQVPADLDLRIISAVLSPDFKTICVAANDQTIRFYEVWTTEAGLVTGVHGSLYGSDLIDLTEGIEKHGGIIR